MGSGTLAQTQATFPEDLPAVDRFHDVNDRLLHLRFGHIEPTGRPLHAIDDPLPHERLQQLAYRVLTTVDQFRDLPDARLDPRLLPGSQVRNRLDGGFAGYTQHLPFI